MTKKCFSHEVFYEAVSVLVKLGHEGAELEESVDPAAHGEVVGLGDDVYPVREGALAAHVLLEGGGGGAAAVHLPVEDGHRHQGVGQLPNVRLHHLIEKKIIYKFIALIWENERTSGSYALANAQQT